MQGLIAAGAGFLMAVLWFDLMFDVQVRGHESGDELPEGVIASIATYYRRVTTDARPMNRLIAAWMLVTVGAIVVQAVRCDTARWVSAVSLVAAVLPIGLAGARTVPSAVRLGLRTDGPAEQARLARRIYADHRFCIASIAVLLVVQVVFG